MKQRVKDKIYFINAEREARLEELKRSAAQRPCGTRSKYNSGCRCDECRTANRLYERDRSRRALRGDVNPIIDAEPVRLHIHELRRRGIGTRTIAEYSDVGRSCITEIASGRKTQVRKKTADAILAVDRTCVRDGSLVPAGKTWNLINWMLDEGFTKARIAKELGRERPALQIGRRRVTAKTAVSVRRLHGRYTLGE